MLLWRVCPTTKTCRASWSPQAAGSARLGFNTLPATQATSAGLHRGSLPNRCTRRWQFLRVRLAAPWVNFSPKGGYAILADICKYLTLIWRDSRSNSGVKNVKVAGRQGRSPLHWACEWDTCMIQEWWCNEEKNTLVHARREKPETLKAAGPPADVPGDRLIVTMWTETSSLHVARFSPFTLRCLCSFLSTFRFSRSVQSVAKLANININMRTHFCTYVCQIQWMATYRFWIRFVTRCLCDSLREDCCRRSSTTRLNRRRRGTARIACAVCLGRVSAPACPPLAETKHKLVDPRM